MDGLVIRQAGPDDADTLHAAIMALAEHQDEAAFVQTDPSGLRAALTGPDPKAVFLIAVLDDRVAGYLSWVTVYSIWRAGDYLNLDDLYVFDDMRGRGVGEALMRRFAEIAVAANLPARWEVKPDNAGARAFYRRLGADLSDKVIVRWSVPAMTGDTR